MINSVNTLEFLKPKLITMDKFKTTTTTRILPPSSSLAQTRTFVTFTHQHATNDSQQQIKQQNLITEEVQQQQRVKVQHLQNHAKLQNNNCWNNYRTLYQLSASSGDREVNSRTIRQNTPIKPIANTRNNDEVDVEHFTTTNTNIQQNTSAFNLDINCNKKKYYNINSIYGNITEANNINNNSIVNNFHSKHFGGLINNQTPFVLMTPQRTKDQDHAYRHIESVHNYAKLKSYEDDDIESPNGSRHSSYLDDDEDEDDEDENDEDENDIVYGDPLNQGGLALSNGLDVDYEVIFNRRRLQNSSTSSEGANVSRGAIRKPLQLAAETKNDDDGDDDDDDLHIDVDVETVDTQNITPAAAAAIAKPIAVNNQIIESSPIKPDHHARRPMNAFLIFCKRHRAIVKERYKNLENRAITKILGDWWASLDADDKKCFTSLAQLNKDAFFSANPNFKWYKLPAPPLRTLTTRPANVTGQEYEYDNDANTAAAAAAAAAAMETISNNTRSSISNSNYFKLADEAQMGDLSQLMQDKSKTSTKLCAALQEALGETSQFIKAHITGTDELLENKQLKRQRLDNENSFSSNSSEEDALLQPTKKSARSCKGKIYQELINSGQIATAVKSKSKSSLRLLVEGDNMDLEGKQSLSNNNNISCQKPSVSESEHMMPFDMTNFDLEERIKVLPALNLDDYLQRKRNTKKKKKFAAGNKKRGKSSNNNNSNNINTTTSLNTKHQVSQDITMNRNIMQLQQKQAAAVVGSQKRKARKESITRRDVSAIEQEVASLLPHTFNGCYYFQEASPPKPPQLTYVKPMETTITTTPHLQTSPSIIPLQTASMTSPSSAVDIINNNNNNNNNLNDNISSSTSDLLILAEVAANRTELKH